MLETRRAFAAVTVSNWLYAIGSGSQWDVERAYIKPDGTLGAWEPDASMSMRRWNLAAVPVGRFIYAIGSGDMHPYPQVERTYVNQDGRLAPWEAVAPMTTGRRYLSAVYAHGYLYAIGSESSDGGGSTVERAAVRSDGSLSPWQLTGYLPDTRSRGAAVIARDHIYLTAGWTRVVERAQLNRVGLRAPTPAAAWPDRPTTITLHGSNFLPGAQARLGTATSLSVSFVTTTTLSATVPAGLEPGWYALTIINADGRRTSADNAVLVNGPLRVDTATPPGGTDAERTEVTITGENFAPPLDVRLGDWPLEDVTFVSSSMLTATVPLGLPAGSYDLTVRHRHAQSSTRPAAFVVAPTGTTPTLGPWEVAPKLNVGGLTRYAFTVPGFVVAVHAFNPNNGVERARIAPDGSISAWERLPSGSQLRLGACAPGITRREDSLYLVGGARCDNMWTELAYVERVRIKPDGSLGTWQALAPLPSPRYGAAALATKDFLYVLGGSGSSRTRSTVERAPILLDGTLGAWEPQSSLLTARARHAVVQVDGYLYVLGGYNSRDWDIGNSVERAAINPDGTLGPWQRVSSMVSLHLDHSALAVGGYLYVLGGDHSIVERAAIKPDGTLGAWQVVSTVDGRRTIPGVVHIGRYLYAIGGDTVGSVTRAPISGLVPPYPIYIPPGTYEVNRCGEADLIVSGRNAGRLTECVPSVEVRADGYMQFNFTWYVDLADDVPSVIKKSDAGNRKMYITDNQGNRYDHVALGGAAAEERRMYDRSTVSGWFLFLPAKRDATTFAFHDDDNRLLINDIVLSP